MKSLSVSVVKSTTKTNLNHNNRELTKNEMRSNTHINTSMSDSNIYLVQESIKELYEKEFSEALENYNNKQKRKDRKIDNYYDHISNSKKTATQQEMIFQIGGTEDFKTETDRQEAIEILKETFFEFRDRNSQLKIFNAVIHNDEATPHMHINFVPVAEGYKRGLEKQVAFDKAILQQDSELNKERPFAEWRANEVLAIESRLQDRGIKRKEVGTNYISDVNTYKYLKDLEKDIELKEIKTKDLDKVISSNERLKIQNERLIKNTTLGTKKAQKDLEKYKQDLKEPLLNNDKIQIPKKDFEGIEKKFMQYSFVNQQLSAENNKLHEVRESLKQENTDLKRKNNALKVELEELEKLKSERNFDETLYQAFKPFLRTHHDKIQKAIDMFPIKESLKRYLKGFVSGALNDKDLKHSKEVAYISNTMDHKAALNLFKIGITSKEHEKLNIITNENRNVKKHKNIKLSRK